MALRNCHPMKNLALPIVQIPLWISCSIALRNASGAYSIDGVSIPPTIAGLDSESFAWIPNLLLPDSSGALSILVGLTYLTMNEINAYKAYGGEPKLREGRSLRAFSVVVNCHRGFSVIVVPMIAYQVPSTVALYWLTSGLVGHLHNFIIMSPKFRRKCGIILGASPYDTPYRNIVHGFKSHWKL